MLVPALCAARQSRSRGRDHRGGRAIDPAVDRARSSKTWATSWQSPASASREAPRSRTSDGACSARRLSSSAARRATTPTGSRLRCSKSCSIRPVADEVDRPADVDGRASGDWWPKRTRTWSASRRFHPAAWPTLAICASGSMPDFPICESSSAAGERSRRAGNDATSWSSRVLEHGGHPARNPPAAPVPGSAA